MATPRVAFLSLLLNATDWTPLTALIDCDTATIWNTPGGWFGVGAQAVTLRSDPADATAGKPLAVGTQEHFGPPTRHAHNVVERRWRRGDVICYAKADSGTSEVILTCLD